MRKRCNRCKQWKSRDKFHKDRNRRDGHYCYCKLCVKKLGRKRMSDPVLRVHRRAIGLESYNKQHKTLTGYLRYLFHDMKSGCTNTDDTTYEYYGGLGIRCLFRDANSFIDHIVNDLKFDTLKKLEGLVLNRIDPFEHFTPGNIRFVTKSQSARSQRKRENCSSRYKGVSRRKDRGTWQAYIKLNGHKRHLGTYKKQRDAALAYDRAAIEHFGEFALTNEMLGLL